ncbi:MAG: T9SS type A sorting domain-containing protein [Bacteroidales bacterium]|nr:T9SS type A sorting domain-containing protein [Bacteroidales bacterium]
MKNLMLFVLLLFNVSVIHSQGCLLLFSDQVVDVIDNKIRIIQSAGFPFGYGSTCPDIDLYSIDVSQNQVIVQFYYLAAGAWQSVGCESIDTFFSNPFAVSSYDLIIHTNLIVDGYIYPDLDTLHDCEIDTFNFEILGLSENSLNSKELYPNPSNGLLTINKAAPIKDIEIYTISGLLVQKVKINAKSAALDVSALPPGHYLLRAIGRDEVWVEKFVVIR